MIEVSTPAPQLIGAIVGAVVAGVIGVYTAMQIHKRELEASRKSLATAIYKEMDNLLSLIEGLVRAPSDDVRAECLMQVVHNLQYHTRIYSSNLDKIGSLGVARAGKLVAFYNLFEQYIRFIDPLDQRNVSPETRQTFVSSLKDCCISGRNIQRELLPLVFSP